MELILLFAVLVCPIAMGAMTFLMMRGMRSHGASHERTEEEKAPVSRLKTGHPRELTATMRMRLSPRKLAIGATVAIASIALVMGLLLSTGDGTVPAAGVAPAADREQAPELEGDWIVPPPVRLAELRGRPVIINF